MYQRCLFTDACLGVEGQTLQLHVHRVVAQPQPSCFEAMLSITMQEGKTVIPVLNPIAVSDRQV